MYLRTYSGIWLAAVFMFLVIPAIKVLRNIDTAQAATPRMPAVAGSFYPADPKALTAMMDGMLAQTNTGPNQDEIYAIVAPHAGYEYSGPVAAYAYAALKGHKYSRVVVIAPSHYEAFDFTSVYEGDAYQTPLGAIPVDHAFAVQLAKESRTIRLSSRGHAPTPHGGEHAIEVELPWLQDVLGSFKLVPIVMGTQDYDSDRALGLALAKLIRDRNTLIVASSDLSHYHTYNQAEKIDHNTLTALQSWDYFSMSRNFDSRTWEACGGGPIIATMIASERMGANQARLLHYANSGDVTGDKTRVVGYAAVAFVHSAIRKVSETTFSLSDEEKRELLSIARKSVEHAVREQQQYEPPTPRSDVLNQERGAFVTLTKEGGLRGCIGYTSAVKPLYLTVRDTATFAALRDPRFPPVTAAELPYLEYEISVLSPLRRILDLQQIQVGRDGLYIRHGDQQGLLLPQVAVDQKWDREKFLDETCVKANMRSDCWKDKDTDVFTFTAVIFGDEKKISLGQDSPASPSQKPQVSELHLLRR